MILLLNTVQLNTKYGFEMSRLWKIANKFSYIYSFLLLFFSTLTIFLFVFSAPAPAVSPVTLKEPLRTHYKSIKSKEPIHFVVQP